MDFKEIERCSREQIAHHEAAHYLAVVEIGLLGCIHDLALPFERGSVERRVCHFLNGPDDERLVSLAMVVLHAGIEAHRRVPGATVESARGYADLRFGTPQHLRRQWPQVDESDAMQQAAAIVAQNADRLELLSAALLEHDIVSAVAAEVIDSLALRRIEIEDAITSLCADGLLRLRVNEVQHALVALPPWLQEQVTRARAHRDECAALLTETAP